jgi:hypothetical protein
MSTLPSGKDVLINLDLIECIEADVSRPESHACEAGPRGLKRGAGVRWAARVSWIPACAGMTPKHPLLVRYLPLDSRLRA